MNHSCWSGESFGLYASEIPLLTLFNFSVAPQQVWDHIVFLAKIRDGFFFLVFFL